MLYKRGNTYWIDVTVGSRRIRRSAFTTDRGQAKELHDSLITDAWRQKNLGDKPKRTFDEAAARWLKEKAHKRSIDEDVARIKFWRDKCQSVTLDQIDTDFVSAHVENLTTWWGKPATNATKNRYCEVMQGILRRAWRWGWIDRIPPIEMLPERNKRVQFFTPEQASAFLAVLPEADRPPVEFAFLTGLRKANVYGLRWDHVDLERGFLWVDGDEAKGGKNIVVPLNADVKALLADLWASRDPRHPRVFGTRVPLRTKAWRRYLALAGLPTSLRFHDTRHSFASWLMMAGADKKTVQELGGWAGPQMLERYIHLSSSHLASTSEKLTGTLRYKSVTPPSLPSLEQAVSA